MPRPSENKSVKSFLADLERQNVTLADWARSNNVDLNTAYMLSKGRLSGYRGEARRVLEKMGVTPPSRLAEQAKQPVTAAA